MFASGPLITTIIPTYRRPKLLRRAILSVLRQSFPGMQVAVYDNASGDETAAVVAELAAHDERVVYFRHEHNIGMIGNFNYGLSRVTTPYFSILSDDDLVLPTFLATTLSGFRQHPDIMFSAGSVLEVSDTGNVIRVPLAGWKNDGYLQPEQSVFEMFGGQHPTITGVLFRREVIDEFGVFDQELAISDFDLILRIAARYPIWMSRVPCALFVNHDASFSTKSDLQAWWNENLRVLAKVSADPDVSGAIRGRLNRAMMDGLTRSVSVLALKAIVSRDFERAHMAAKLLKQLPGRSWRGTVVERATRLCERTAPAHRVFAAGFDAAHALRFLVANRQRRQSFSQFGEHLNAL